MELFGLPTRLQLVLLRVGNSRCPLWRSDSASSVKQHECGRATTFVFPFIIVTNFHTLFIIRSPYDACMKLSCLAFYLASSLQEHNISVSLNAIASYQRFCVGWFDTAPFAIMNSSHRQKMSIFCYSLTHGKEGPDRDCCTCTG